MRKALLSPLTSLLTSLISLVTLSLAVRFGEPAQLVGYTAGLSIGGLVFVALSGGSTLTYVTGAVDTRRAVRRFRTRWVLPGTALLGAGVSYVYSIVSGTPVLPILLGTASSLLIAAAELESNYLRRNLRTPETLAIETGSRIAGLSLVVIGVGYAWALLLVSVLRFAFLFWRASDDPARRGGDDLGVKETARLAVRPSLMSSSILYTGIDRSMFLVFPLVASETMAGYFVALMSAQQAVAGSLASGLMTSMASRSHKREHADESLGWHRNFELIIISLSAAGAAMGALLGNVVLGLLSVPITYETRFIWVAILVAMPFSTAARASQYALMSQSVERGALRSITLEAVGLVVCAIIGISLSSWQITVFAPLTAGILGAAGGALALRSTKGEH